MGRQIVYCEGCGHNLREDDFEKGRARQIDNKPFCTDCRPFRPGEAPPRRPSSSRVPAASAPPRKTSTGAIPVIPAPRRQSGASAGSNPLPILAAVGGALLLVLIFAATQGGSKKTPVTETAAPALVEIPPARRGESSAAPAPLPPAPPATPPPPPPSSRGTPPPPAAPSGPLVAPTASEKLDAFIAQIRGMIQGDERQERTEEILNMFSAAAKSAGPRAGEVAKLKSDYLGTLTEETRRAVAWADWRITSSAEAGMTGLLPSHRNRNNVYQTTPTGKTIPAKLERSIEVPPGKKTTFTFWVVGDLTGDFELRVFVDDQPVMKDTIGPPGSDWRQKTLDLTPYAGKRITLRLENSGTDSARGSGYWSDFAISSE